MISPRLAAKALNCSSLRPRFRDGIVTHTRYIASEEIGTVVFLIALYVAAQRSRDSAIGVGGLFFLGDAAPTPVRCGMSCILN